MSDLFYILGVVFSLLGVAYAFVYLFYSIEICIKCDKMYNSIRTLLFLILLILSVTLFVYTLIP